MFNCKFCQRLLSRKCSLTKHESSCFSNPNRIHKVSWKKGKTKEELPHLQRSTETKLKISEKSKGRKHTEESKSILSKIAKERGFGGITQSRWIDYKGKKLGSSYELTVAKSLDENNIKWDTCKRFNYIDPNGKARTYTPDFYLPEYNVYLDPKNDFLINKINPALGFNDCEKIRRVEEQNNIKVIVLNKNQLQWNNIKMLVLP